MSLTKIKSFFKKNTDKASKKAKKVADRNKDGKVDLKDVKAAKNKAVKSVKKATSKKK